LLRGDKNWVSVIHEQNNYPELDSEVNSIGMPRRSFKRSLAEAAGIEPATPFITY
jgi:hypothetical protein